MPAAFFGLPLLLYLGAPLLAQKPPNDLSPEVAEAAPLNGIDEPSPIEGDQADGEAHGGVAPGAPTIGLAAAVRFALERNYGMLSSQDSVAAAHYREQAAFSEFLPQVVPRVGRAEGNTTFGVDGSQRLPWTGGAVTVGGSAEPPSPRPRAPTRKPRNVRVQLTQPLLRGAGPNATFYDLRNSRRAVETQERSNVLTKQRLAIQVTAAFYGVVAQRQLVVVSRQSWKRTLALQRASEARLKVGLASKLDVFRAELQASQTQEALIRQQAALQSALEQFRALLALSPSDPLEPEAVDAARSPPARRTNPSTCSRRSSPREPPGAQGGPCPGGGRKTESELRPAEPPAPARSQPRLQPTRARFVVWRVVARGQRPPLVRLLDLLSPRRGQTRRPSTPMATLDLASRERSAVQREQEVEADVRSAVRELDRIRKSFELQRKGVEAAAQQQRLASLRYQRGLASNFDVVDAEGSLLFARSALVSLFVSYKVAEVELLRAMGTLDVEREFAP